MDERTENGVQRLLSADELKNKAVLSKDEKIRLYELTCDEFEKKPIDEWTDRELLLSCPQYVEYDSISEEDALKEIVNLRKYLKEYNDSQGFDITGPVPKISITQQCIYPVELRTKKQHKFAKNLAEAAIQSYNDNNDDFPAKTNFQVVQVEKVTMSMVPWDTFYITFTAKDESPGKRYRSPKTFQAKVAVAPSYRPNANEPIVDFCRLKAKR